MRTSFLALLLVIISCTAASAQGCGPQNPGCIVPTAPHGTSNNQAASTAFVQDAVSGAGGDVTGPSSSVSGNIATFNGTTGKIIQDSGVSPSSLVTGPGSSASGNLPSFSGTSGKILQDSGVPASSVVTTSNASTAWATICGNTIGFVWARLTGGWACSPSFDAPVTWWGAACNGSTDDTSAINTAIASGIAAVTIPAVCNVTTLNTLPKNFTLHGLNQVGSCLQTTSATGNVLTMNAAGGDTVKDLCFQTTVTRTSGDFIYATGGSVTINNLLMYGFYNGLELNGVGSPGTTCPAPFNIAPCGGAHVSNLKMYGSPSGATSHECILADGISGSNSNPDNDAYIENIWCSGVSSGTALTNGFEIVSAGEIHITHADFENVSGANILVDPNGPASTGHYIAWLVMDDCLLDATATYGLRVYASNGAGIQNVDLHDGWIANNQYGVWIGTDTGNSSFIIEAKVHHEHIINQTGDGIHLDDNSNIGASFIGDNYVLNASGTNSAFYTGAGVTGFNLHNNSFQGSTYGGNFPSATLSATVAIGNLFAGGTQAVAGSPTLTVNGLNNPAIP